MSRNVHQKHPTQPSFTRLEKDLHKLADRREYFDNAIIGRAVLPGQVSLSRQDRNLFTKNAIVYTPRQSLLVHFREGAVRNIGRRNNHRVATLEQRIEDADSHLAQNLNIATHRLRLLEAGSTPERCAYWISGWVKEASYDDGTSASVTAEKQVICRGLNFTDETASRLWLGRIDGPSEGDSLDTAGAILLQVLPAHLMLGAVSLVDNSPQNHEL